MDDLDPKEIGEAVRKARKALGLGQEALAEKSGSDQSTVQRIEAGKFKRLPSDLPKILHALQIDPIGLLDPGTFLATPHTLPFARPSDALMPVYGMAEGGKGAMIISPDPIETIGRPPDLMGVKEAYAVRVVGDSMVPAFRPGDLAFVHPALPPLSGHEVVLQRDDHGTRYGLIKTFLDVKGDALRVVQYNPRRVLILRASEWPICHTVVGRRIPH